MKHRATVPGHQLSSSTNTPADGGTNQPLAGAGGDGCTSCARASASRAAFAPRKAGKRLTVRPVAIRKNHEHFPRTGLAGGEERWPCDFTLLLRHRLVAAGRASSVTDSTLVPGHSPAKRNDRSDPSSPNTKRSRDLGWVCPHSSSITSGPAPCSDFLAPMICWVMAHPPNHSQHQVSATSSSCNELGVPFPSWGEGGAKPSCRLTKAPPPVRTSTPRHREKVSPFQQ